MDYLLKRFEEESLKEESFDIGEIAIMLVPKLKKKINDLQYMLKQTDQKTQLVEIDAGDSSAWECTSCKNLWVFIDGTPEENNYNYCAFCGRKIEYT